MRVALISEWLDAWRGGAEKSTLQFLHHLMGSGVELHVFTRSRPSPTPGMAVHTISGAAMSRTRRSMTFARRVERLLRSETFDIAHAISPCRGIDIYQPRGGTVAESVQRNLALHRAPTMRLAKRHANLFNFKQRYMLALERRLFESPDGPVIVAISDYVVRQLQNHFGVPKERIRKIYNGVNVDASTTEERIRDRIRIRRMFSIADEDLLVILVAHNFRLKGVQRWMEALSVLNGAGATGIRSIVIGKGESDHWHRTAARLGIADRLTFAGPSDRVRAFHHAADVLVHPTYYDPCSRVVLEAMVAGLPVVTTRWDGAAEMVVDGENGYVLDDPDHVDLLVDRIERLRDRDHREALGAGAAKVAEQVSMARHAREMLGLYEDLSAPA